MRPGLLFVVALALAMRTPQAFAVDTTCPSTGGPALAKSYCDHGTPGLTARIHTLWKLGGLDGNKLPYFSQHYDWSIEKHPNMTVEARRLDGEAPIVRAERVNGATLAPLKRESSSAIRTDFMVTALHIPTAGCWEITARYTPPSGKVETLSYTILVEP